MVEAPRQAPAPAPVDPELRRAVELVRGNKTDELKQELKQKTVEQLSKLLDIVAAEKVSAEVRDVLRQAGIEKGLADLDARLGKLTILSSQERREKSEGPGVVDKLAAMTTVGLMGMKIKGGDSWYGKAAGSILSFLSGGAEDPVTATRAIGRNLRKGFYMVLSSPGFLGLDKITFLGSFFEGARDKVNQLKVAEELEAIAAEEQVDFDDRVDMASWKRLVRNAKAQGTEVVEFAANLATKFLGEARKQGEHITLSLWNMVAPAASPPPATRPS